MTYPDGTKDEVAVTIEVVDNRTDAEKYDPQGQDVTTDLGVVPEAKAGIKDADELPVGTQFQWKEAPDVTKAGETSGIVLVTYPDGTTDEVIVLVTVVDNRTDAEKYDPEAQGVTTDINVVPEAKAGIKDADELPAGTQFQWKDEPDVSKEGETSGTVLVTYPDGTTDEVIVPITVVDNRTDAEKYDPEAQDVTTDINVVPDAQDGIKDADELPEGTSYEWKDTPDVSKGGTTTGTVVVTYPDGTKDEVEVTIEVVDNRTDAEKYDPEGQDVTTDLGVVPDAQDGIKDADELPDGTSYEWKDTPDVSKEGTTTGTVVVTYPDGTKDEVEVTIIVEDNDIYDPEGQDVTTWFEAVPDAEDAIKNKDELPEGTKYDWKETPDVSEPGDVPATVVVIYPDGTSEEVEVTIKVKPAVIKGVVIDNKTGKPVEGAEVKVAQDFDGDGIVDFKHEVITGADGKYSMPIPRGDMEYELEIIKPGEDVSFKQKAIIENEITPGDKLEFRAEKTFVGVILLKNLDPECDDQIYGKNGETVIIRQITPDGSPGKTGTVDPETGVFTVDDLELEVPYEFVVVTVVDGKELIMGKIETILTKDDDGEIRIHEELIDPYGTVTDAKTGKILKDVRVELYYADTKGNRDKGITPGTPVELPEMLGFAPNDNANEQYTNDHGNYAWMVYPETDYYIIGTKTGYENYKSKIISVEYDVIRFDFAMTPKC